MGGFRRQILADIRQTLGFSEEQWAEESCALVDSKRERIASGAGTIRQQIKRSRRWIGKGQDANSGTTLRVVEVLLAEILERPG
jgi:hypothetical protein